MNLLPIILVGGAAAIYFLGLGRTGANLQFLFRNIRLSGGSIIQPNIIITIGVQNPTNNPVTINSIVGTLNYQGQNFANFSSFERTTIKANSETLINITAIPNFTGVVTILKEVILNKQKGAIINMKATANINNIAFPINSSFQF
jgi:LEA14-like dessication related protein